MVDLMQHVPLWAAFVFLGVLWRGICACPVSQALVLPAAMLLWSVWGMSAGGVTPVLATGWIGAATSVFAVCRSLGYPAGVVLEPTKTLVRMPGSALTLVLMLVLYMAHFVGESHAATHAGAVLPAAAARLGVVAVYGGASGVSLARLHALFRLIVRQRVVKGEIRGEMRE